MARYLVSLLVCAIGIACTILATGGSAWNYLDLPSFIMVGLLPFLFVSVLFGFRNMAAAFSVALKKESGKDALMHALHFFKMYAKTTWFAVLIAVIIGIVGTLATLNDLSQIGPYFALALVSPLYCGIINMVIIIPFTIFIKKHLKEC
jgi:flagellar motor component MotA